MKPYQLVLLICSFLITTTLTLGQSAQEQQIKRAAKGKTGVSPEELVSFKSDVLFGQAIESLNEMSKKFLRKPIVDTSPIKSKTIGVNIESMYWKDAFELILRTNNLWYDEKQDYIQVISMDEAALRGAQIPGGPVAVPTAQGGATRIDTGAVLARTREVLISAIFVEIDQSKLRESGISFKLFRGRDLNLGVEFDGATKVSSNIFKVEATPRSNKLAVDIDAAVRFFESEQFGEVIARPQVTVRSGGTGRVQIGQDFSIKERDFGGNILDKFYNAGTILDVQPRVYTYAGTELIDLNLKVERSSVQPGAVSTLVNKTQAQNSLILLDGEESYAGGLYINEDQTTREGIPFLKDLPWWFFGLRYIFGYDLKRVTTKELLVLIRAQLVPMVDERITQRDLQRNVIQEKRNEIREDIQKRKSKQ